jgi:hypothetical protein
MVKFERNLGRRISESAFLELVSLGPIIPSFVAEVGSFYLDGRSFGKSLSLCGLVRLGFSVSCSEPNAFLWGQLSLMG